MAVQTKICSKCAFELRPSDFYASPSSRDGLDSKCKECAKATARANRRKKIGYYREYDRRRYQESGARGDSSPAAKCRAKSNWAARNPDKRRAQVAVGNALRDGRLKREPCCVCGEPKTQAHHEDYSKPLAVIWLCSEHHAIHHRIEHAAARALAAADD